jgi:hypothetical protein
VVTRVDVFLMGLQRPVVSNLTVLLGTKLIPEGELDISTSNSTYSLLVVQINNTNSGSSSVARANNVKDEKMGVRGTFLLGFAPLKLVAPTIYPALLSSSNNDNVICRLYWKLTEA